MERGKKKNVVLAVLVVLAFCGSAWADVVVPDVVGQSEPVADSAIIAAGLIVGDVTYEYSDGVAAGLITSQNPVGGSVVPIGSSVDIVVSLGQPPVVAALGGGRLVELQNNDGGWDRPLYDGDPNAGSDPETFGSIAIGLVQAYRQTADPNILAALQKAKAYLLGKTDDFTVIDGAFAVELDSILGGTESADYVTVNFYNKLEAGTYYDLMSDTVYDTNSFIQYRRQSHDVSYANLAAWDVGLGLYSTHVIGANTLEWIVGVKAEIDELDGYSDYDVLGLAGAVFGLAVAGEDYDPQAGEHASASSLDELAATLASYQLSTGGFTWRSGFMEAGDETIQETVYATLALNELDGATYLSQISNASIYVQNVQLGTGGWGNYMGAGEDNETTGQALQCITASAIQAVVPDVTGQNEADANSTITSAILVIGTVTYEYSDTVAAGLVISQDPVGGSVVSIGSSVDLVVSLGQPVVPDVVGQTETDANTAITAVDNLTVGTVTYEYSDTVANGVVISHDPVGGSVVPIWSSVDLVVSLGPPIGEEGAYYVDGVDGNDLNDGLTHITAFATIGRGIDASQDGNTVLVYPGVYNEEVDFDGKAITVQSVDEPAVITAPGFYAVSFFHGEGPNSVLKNFIIKDSYAGLLFLIASPTVSNVTVVDSNTGALADGGANPNIINCIFWDNNEGDLFGCQAQYSCIEDGDEGLGNISADPLFVDANNGDYHLKSVGWRWAGDGGGWVWDAVTSRCIDSGNPGTPLRSEPMSVPGDPNNMWGENIRVNMGAYGGTSQAGIPPYGWALLADLNNDGATDFVDVGLWAQYWLSPGYELPGDLDRGGAVNFTDFALIEQDFTSWYLPPVYTVLEDFESYAPNPPYIYDTWVDGVVDGQSGSWVELATAPADPVHDGNQAMWYHYDSTGMECEPAYSEAYRVLDPPGDFVANGEDTLVMWFYGQAGNDPEFMWAVLTDSNGVDALSVYGARDEDPNDILTEDWTKWSIPLNAFRGAGVDLSSVVSLSIGFGEERGWGSPPRLNFGVVYFDDIRLYPLP